MKNNYLTLMFNLNLKKEVLNYLHNRFYKNLFLSLYTLYQKYLFND